ncbi:hypothetical protein [Spirilliplanes yamanashiensis]|uniref:Uncharacterized protein n=1 Tax=Spirilliplanes yamanashiensis TaxID=42233 RepID=A0A8J4DLQ5_9ACTN|nr:hypothetical protein [Spirilliplanes yamanashiensis]MDP9818886.1 hypothetical protein [Spirilliplanes yamanashiensis]GIJ05340.1 hypothetical protein Sya03_46920 [Spirilliplanes yamanashiensis]
MRRVIAVLLAVVAGALAVPAPAAAHAGLALVVNDDGRGSVSVEVTWEDGHPVTEPIAGTLFAVSGAGAQVGPAPLRRLPGTSTLVYGDTLRPGAWQVTVDVAAPGIGHCVASVTAAAAAAGAQPGTTRCAPSPAPAPAVAGGPAGPAAGAGGDGPPVGLIVLLGAAGVAVAGAAVWWARARR